MRFPTEYTCNLMNEARHAAFGKLAAKMVLESLGGEWPKVVLNMHCFSHWSKDSALHMNNNRKNESAS